MSQVGMSWDGSTLQFSFSADRRQEFEAHLEKLHAFADKVWPRDYGADESATRVAEVMDLAANFAGSRPKPLTQSEIMEAYRRGAGLS